MDLVALRVLLRSKLRLDLKGVSTKVITLSLEKVGWKVLSTVTIEPRERSGETWGWETHLGSLSNDVSPSRLSLVDRVLEEVGEEQVLKVWVGAVRIGDVLEEDGADDAAASPHERDGWLVELPTVFLGSLLHQHETLSVGDNLGSVKCLLEVPEELLLVAGELLGAAAVLEEGGGLGALLLDGGQTAGEDGLGDQGDWHTEIERVDGSPLSGSLLASRVEDFFDKWGSVVVVEVHDVAGNLDQEGVKDALVPLGEDITDLLSAHSKTTLHDVIRLCFVSIAGLLK